MGGLTTSANSNVANSDDRYVETATLQYTDAEHRIPKIHSHAVEPAQWQQPLVDFDEIAFHALFFRCFDISKFRGFELI